MNRRRGILWIVAGLLLAILAAALAYYAFQQIVTEQANQVQEEPTQTVVVARELINERGVIRLADISTEKRPVEEVPSGAIFNTDDGPHYHRGHSAGAGCVDPKPGGQFSFFRGGTKRNCNHHR